MTTRQDAFIATFLLLLTLTFAGEAHFWPFMAFDMYARRDIPAVKFEGVTAEGEVVPIDAPRYFRYYPGTFFSMGLSEILRERPAQFAGIAAALRERYNRRASRRLASVRAFVEVNGVSTALGEFR